MNQNSEKKENFGKRGKTAVFLATMVLVLGLSVGTTLAYLTDKTINIENVFTPSDVTTTVEEGFDGNVKSSVKIKNSGDTDAYIRSAVIISWKDEEGKNIAAEIPVEDVDYDITYAENTGWTTKCDDGYFYYTKPVKGGDSTAILVSECKQLKAGPEGYRLSVEIVGSAIQAIPDSVVENAWSNTKTAVKVKDGNLAISKAEQGGN